MKSSKVDLSRHFSLHIAALKLFYMWFFIPHSINSLQFWLHIFMKFILGVLCFLVPTGTQLVYMIKLILSGEAQIEEVAGILNLILAELMTSLKLFDLCLRRHLLTQLIDQLREFDCYNDSHRDILIRATDISRKMFLGLIISSGLDVLIHVVVVPAVNGFQTLPLKMDAIFFDVRDGAHFTYVCAYQILYKPMMLVTFTTLQTFPLAALSCADIRNILITDSQLDVLIHNFEDMNNTVNASKNNYKNFNENKIFRENFKRCILHHYTIIRFIKTLQAAFGGQFTATLFLNACIIGSTAVQIISIESPLKNISDVIWIICYLLLMSMILYIDCYFGNSITVKSQHVSNVAFSCPWLDLSLKNKKDLIIFIAQTQRPVIVTAAKLVPLSLETYTKVMNWSYKGFAVMNQMK